VKARAKRNSSNLLGMYFQVAPQGGISRRIQSSCESAARSLQAKFLRGQLAYLVCK